MLYIILFQIVYAILADIQSPTRRRLNKINYEEIIIKEIAIKVH